MIIWILVIKKTNLENYSYRYPSFYLPIATCWNNAIKIGLYYILWFIKKCSYIFCKKHIKYAVQDTTKEYVHRCDRRKPPDRIVYSSGKCLSRIKWTLAGYAFSLCQETNYTHKPWTYQVCHIRYLRDDLIGDKLEGHRDQYQHDWQL